MNKTFPWTIGLILLLPACGSDDGSNGGSGASTVQMEGSNPGDCSDEADNDGDTLFDCDDPDCRGASSCSGGGGEGDPNSGGGEDASGNPSTSWRTSAPPSWTDDARMVKMQASPTGVYVPPGVGGAGHRRAGRPRPPPESTGPGKSVGNHKN